MNMKDFGTSLPTGAASVQPASVTGAATSDTQVPVASAGATPADAPQGGTAAREPAPRAKALSGIERRRAATAERGAPVESAHVELPVVRPEVRALLGAGTATPPRRSGGLVGRLSTVPGSAERVVEFVVSGRAHAPADAARGFRSAVAALLFDGPIDATLAEHPQVEQ